METQFHILSFEGPDGYSRAGGIASRITGLSEGLADAGYETHLWFIGTPDLVGDEERGNLRLHRWCQWISRYHPGGVYDGEEGKRLDYVDSLPPFLLREVLLPHLMNGGRAVVLAEEWHTVDAVLHLHWLLTQAGLRQQVTILWNANNTFSFHRIDWQRLSDAAIITTVSRYMKHLMWGLGVDPLVISNGLSADAFRPPEREGLSELRHRLKDRVLLSKVARWDPDKRWLFAVHTVRELKREGWFPLLIARGGVEPHGREVMQAAANAGLHVVERWTERPGPHEMVQALTSVNGADIVNLRSPVDADSRRVLFRASSAVLANSGHEPFGLVGLEAMAAGGIACTGCSGEDYVVPGHNALVLETDDPREFVGLMRELRSNPQRERSIRRSAQATARQYAWSRIITRIFLPRLRTLGCAAPTAALA